MSIAAAAAYSIGWSQGQAEVTTPAEVDVVLDRIAADPDGPYLVHVAAVADDGSLLELVWGHAQRAMVIYADTEDGAWAVDDTLVPLADDLDYDHGAIEPARTRVTIGAARRAVHEYVATGLRPASLSWTSDVATA